MTRKRFIKLAMAEGIDREEAKFSALCALNRYGNYAEAYEELYHTISGRFGFYMPKYKKKLAKRRKS